MPDVFTRSKKSSKKPLTAIYSFYAVRGKHIAYHILFTVDFFFFAIYGYLMCVLNTSI